MTSGWHGLPVGRRVLLAEDDVALQEMLALVLSEGGYQVTTVSDGSQLKQLLREPWPKSHFDLIVTDVNMPGGSGLDVIELLRQSGDSTPVIVVTAFPEADIRESANRDFAAGQRAVRLKLTILAVREHPVVDVAVIRATARSKPFSALPATSTQLS